MIKTVILVAFFSGIIISLLGIIVNNLKVKISKLITYTGIGLIYLSGLILMIGGLIKLVDFKWK